MASTAFITGITGGIGGALTEYWTRRGWTIYGSHHTDENGVPDNCQSMQFDFNCPDIELTRFKKMLGSPQETPVDAVVHSAGNLRDQLLLRMDPSEWKSVRRVHLDAAFQLAQFFQPYLTETNGSLILIGSRVGQTGNPGQANYAAAKAGLIGFMRSLAREWAPDIRVNLIRPPLTDSKMTAKLQKENNQTHEKQCLSPEVTLQMIDQATRSDQITGQILSADNRIDSHGW